MTKVNRTRAASAAKRTVRAKTKKVAAGKMKSRAQALKGKTPKFNYDADGKLNFDDVLTGAVRDINSRRKGSTTKEIETSIKSAKDVIDGLIKSTTEIFRIYCYVTLVNNLIESSLISHSLKIDLADISKKLIILDGRIGALGKLYPQEEEVIFTEALEIGTEIQNISEELYSEVVRSEEHALVIEEVLSRLAKEVEGVDDVNKQRFMVLQSIAYRYLAKVKEDIDRESAESSKAASEEQTPAEQQS